MQLSKARDLEVLRFTGRRSSTAREQCGIAVGISTFRNRKPVKSILEKNVQLPVQQVATEATLTLG
jgi:hypothetical protein